MIRRTALILSALLHLGAAEFDSVGDHVDFGAVDVSSGIDTISLFCWVDLNNFDTGDQRIWSKATDQGVQDHWIMLSGNSATQMRVRLKTGTTTTHFETSSAINTDQWYHMGFVYDGSDIIFYRDGVANGSSAKTGNVATSGAVDARAADNPGPIRKELDGSLDDCRLYEYALTPNAVQTLFAARGRDRIIPKFRWLFNEGAIGVTLSGSGITKDHGPGGFDGTPGGNPVYVESILHPR